MNSIEGRIKTIANAGSLSVVSLDTISNEIIKVIVLDTPDTAPYLQLGKQVKAVFKETEVIVGSTAADTHISIENKIKGRVLKIEKGNLLCQLIIETKLGTISAVLTTDALARMEITVAKDVVVMIKINEIMLSEC